MKFDPLKKEIYTDTGEFIKTIDCPYKMRWDNLDTANSTMRKCATCDQLIVDTDGMSDNEILRMVKQAPGICLKIDLNQHNLKMVSNGNLNQK